MKEQPVFIGFDFGEEPSFSVESWRDGNGIWHHRRLAPSAQPSAQLNPSTAQIEREQNGTE